MSTTLYREAIAEAQQLKEAAEQNAKNKIIEALTPRIQAMVESQLLSEQGEIEFDDFENVEDDVGDSVVDPMMGALEAVADELVYDDDDDDSDIDAEVEANVVINAQGDVNVAMAENVRNNLRNIKEVINNSASSNENKLANKIAKLQGKVRRMDALLESIDADALTNEQRAVIKKSYQKMLGEAFTLRSEAIVISESVGQGIRLQLFETLKEMNTMTKNRSRAIFNQLFEAGYGELDEMELVLSDEDLEALGVEDAEDANVDDLDIEVALDIGDSVEAGDAFDDEADEEVAEEEEEDTAAEEEEGDELELEGDHLDEVFEINPATLRRELRRLRGIREQAEDQADQFGGGEVELEVMEVDEEDLLNALADELGQVSDSAPAAPVAERRTRRARRSNRKDNATIAENRELKKQLTEMNLFNAKLLYVNKLIQNRNVSSKQQRAIVEALDNAKTIREAKLVYEGLTRSLNNKKSLSEGTRRVLGSSSKPTRSGSATVNESTQTNRWATLAGIK